MTVTRTTQSSPMRSSPMWPSQSQHRVHREMHMHIFTDWAGNSLAHLRCLFFSSLARKQKPSQGTQNYTHLSVWHFFKAKNFQRDPAQSSGHATLGTVISDVVLVLPSSHLWFEKLFQRVPPSIYPLPVPLSGNWNHKSIHGSLTGLEGSLSTVSFRTKFLSWWSSRTFVTDSLSRAEETC